MEKIQSLGTFASGKYDTSNPDIKPTVQNPKKPLSSRQHVPASYRAYSYSDPSHVTCNLCREDAFSVLLQDICIAGAFVKVSIPCTVSYHPFFVDTSKVAGDNSNLPNQDFMSTCMSLNRIQSVKPSEPHKTLETWLFTPTYKRANVATLNYRHTMVSDKRSTKCYYQHFLVVREEDFNTYRAIWGNTHAIVQLPKSMAECEADVTSGIGYARLFIQRFARHFHRDYIFMLDDNIACVREIVTKRSGDKEVLIRHDGDLQMTGVPLFNVLKHLESQFLRDSVSPLKVNFDPYSGTENRASLEQYTGPNNKYAALGILKERMGSL